MKIDECLNNVRCFTASCNKFAKYNIDTNGFKGNISLCEDCFKELSKLILNINKQNNNSGEQKIENTTKKRK